MGPRKFDKACIAYQHPTQQAIIVTDHTNILMRSPFERGTIATSISFFFLTFAKDFDHFR